MSFAGGISLWGAVAGMGWAATVGGSLMRALACRRIRGGETCLACSDEGHGGFSPNEGRQAGDVAGRAIPVERNLCSAGHVHSIAK